MHSYRFIRLLGAVTVLLVALMAFTPVSNKIGNLLTIGTALEPCDAIVVLGSGLGRDGELSDDSLRRAMRGIELYKRGLAPLIVFSGARRPGAPVRSEAEARSRLAVELGVPPEAILEVEDVRTTHDEAVQVSTILSKPEQRKVLLVTESLHLRRAKLAFERAGFQVAPAASDSYSRSALSGASRFGLAARIAYEFGGLVYYKMAGYI
jgi:uncharacterized SAM-binding protein YcdF (DUF218 family)